MPGAGKFEALTRIGFAARGIMYVLIGYLALRTGRAAESSQALDYLASGIGRLLVAAMALGFFAYGGWRILDAWFDASGRGSGAKGAAARGGGAISGLIHLGLGVGAALLAAGAAGGGGNSSTETGAATALTLPAGGVLLVLVAAGLLLTGLFQIRKAWTLSFLQHLDGHAGSRSWLCWLGRAGFLARGIVFLIMAWLFWRAGREESSQQAGGIADALHSLPSGLQMAVASGLLLFGLFSFVEARFRRIHADALTRFG